MDLRKYLNIFQQYNIYTIAQRILIRIFFKVRGLFFRKYIRRYNKFKNDVFIVYSMGKTGSSSVYYTLLKEFPFNNVFHVHMLEDYLLNNRQDRNVILAKKVKDYLKKNSPKNIWTISLYREPVGRKLSDYFQLKKNREEKYSLDEIISSLGEGEARDTSYYWFEKDFLKFTSHTEKDILNSKIDNYYIVSTQNMHSLIMRTDFLNSHFTKAFSKFVNVTDIELYSFNKRDEKNIKELYKKVKANYKEPYDKLEERYSSSLFKMFYTDNEKQELLKKWGTRNNIVS